MRSAILEFSLQYVECDLAPKWAEQRPVVEVFFDRNFTRSRATGGIQDIALDEDDLSKTYDGKLSAIVPVRTGEIPSSACVGIASFAVRRNDFGAPCYVDVGTTHVNLQEVATALAHDGDGGGLFQRELNMVLHTTHPFGPQSGGNGEVVKGKIVFRVTKLDLSGVPISSRPSLLGGPVGVAQQLIMSYIQQCMEQELRMKDTLPGTSKIRAPMDISESGIELVENMFLPVSAFALVETPRSNLEYWRNIFERIQRRRGMTIRDYKLFDKVEKARTMVLMMAYEAQTFDYISDEVDRNNRRDRMYQALLKHGFENFGNALITASGDCEDTATVIKQVMSAFIAYNFPTEYVELREMQEIAKQYVQFLTLATVWGQKVGDINAEKGAHMYLALPPLYQVRKMLAKTPEGRDVLASQPWPANIVPDPELPTMFGEGTGMIDPLGYTDPMIQERIYVMKLHTVTGFKKELPHQRGAPSSFYLGNLMAITSLHFDLGGTVGGYIYGTMDEQSGTITRGALWTEFINQSERLCLLPQPPIPKALLNLMYSATAIRVPPRALLFDPEKARGNAYRTFEPLDRIVDAVEAMNRVYPDTPKEPIDVFIRPNQMDNALADKIISEIRSKEKIYAVDYELEHITTDLWQYRMKVYVRDE